MKRRKLINTLISLIAVPIIACSNPTGPKPDPGYIKPLKETLIVSIIEEYSEIWAKVKVQNVGDKTAEDCYAIYNVYNPDGSGYYYTLYPIYPSNIRPKEFGIAMTADYENDRYRLIYNKERGLGAIGIEFYPSGEKLLWNAIKFPERE